MTLVSSGSPKPPGNLQRMLERVVQGSGKEHKMVQLSRLNINPCLGCVKCADSHRCAQNDDMAPLYDRILNSDALIVGAPVYFGHSNTFTQTFLEQLFLLLHTHMLTHGKPVGIMAVGEHEAEKVARLPVS